MTTPEPKLHVEGLSAGYGDMTVLHGITFRACAGTITAVAGANGSGKTTLLKASMGLLTACEGSVRLGQDDISNLGVARRIALGMGLVPEGRGLFSTMSVSDNLRLGGRAGGLSSRELRKSMTNALDLFPALEDKFFAPAGSLSGGQQQMLSLARALTAKPKVILLDEPSMGLAPKVWTELLELVRSLADDGCTVILAEQKIRPVLTISDNCVVLQRGHMAFSGEASGSDVLESINDAYLETAVSAAGKEQ